MPTTGEERCCPPKEPKKGAPPKAKTPPSGAASQYPPAPSDPARAMATGDWAKGADPSGPRFGADPNAVTLFGRAAVVAAEAVRGPDPDPVSGSRPPKTS